MGTGGDWVGADLSHLRYFRAQFHSYIRLVMLARLLDVSARICLIACFCYIFRPYGILVFIAFEVVFMTACYTSAFGCSELGKGLYTAIMPGGWLSVPVAFLSPMTEYKGQGKRLMTAYCVQKAVGSATMAALMFLLQPDQAWNMLCGGLFYVFLALFAEALWRLVQPSVCWSQKWCVDDLRRADTYQCVKHVSANS